MKGAPFDTWSLPPPPPPPPRRSERNAVMKGEKRNCGSKKGRGKSAKTRLVSAKVASALSRWFGGAKKGNFSGRLSRCSTDVIKLGPPLFVRLAMYEENRGGEKKMSTCEVAKMSGSIPKWQGGGRGNFYFVCCT